MVVPVHEKGASQMRVWSMQDMCQRCQLNGRPFRGVQSLYVPAQFSAEGRGVSAVCARSFAVAGTNQVGGRSAGGWA